MITIENAKIRFRNFSGAPDKFNPQGGKRSFAVFLDLPMADQLHEEGWNIKVLKPREEGDQPQPYLPVKIVYGKVPPKVVVVRPDGSLEPLDEDTIDLLDSAELEYVDLVIRPYDWEMNGNSGRTAYLKSMYVTLAETELDRKYRTRAQGRND